MCCWCAELMMRLWCIVVTQMTHRWCTDNAQKRQWWCTDDTHIIHCWYDNAQMMRWWWIDDMLMMHWWCIEDVLMMRWWCTGDTQYNFFKSLSPLFFKNIAYCNGQLEGWVSNLLFYIISFSLFEVVYSRTFLGAVFFGRKPRIILFLSKV